MKTKEKDEKRKISTRFIGESITVILIFFILAFSILEITDLQQHLTQANLTIAQEHSQILNLTHSLAQANATVQALRSNLSQAQSAITQQKAQISNLINILNLNESQVIFNKPISIGPSSLMSTCTTFSCSFYYSYIANMALHFNFTHAGYIVINTTGQSYVGLLLTQNYSKTWFGANISDVAGIFNFSVRSLTMPVLPGPSMLKLYYYNATAPYEAQLTITYHS